MQVLHEYITRVKSDLYKDRINKQILHTGIYACSPGRDTSVSNNPFYSCVPVTWPLSGSQAGGGLVLIQTSCFSYVNANYNPGQKSWETFAKTPQIRASPPTQYAVLI